MSCPHRALNQSDLITWWIWFSLVLSRHLFYFFYLTNNFSNIIPYKMMSYDPIPACNLNPLLDALVISTLNIQFFQLTCQVRSLLLLIPLPIRAFIAVLDKKKKKKRERYSLGIFLNSSWYSNFKTPNVTQPFRNSEKIHRIFFFLKPSGWFCLVVSDTRGKKAKSALLTLALYILKRRNINMHTVM